MANRAALLTLTRLMSYGLMLVSPIILVRLLSVQQFGEYREFLLYASLMQAFGAFFIPDSLLYFIPAHPHSPWRVVRHSAGLLLCSSAITVLVVLAADRLTGGTLVGGYLWPLVGFTLCAVNLDFWECFFLALGRPYAVLAYAVGRLAVRLTVVTVAAALTRNVATIIWTLVASEALRLLGAALALAVLDRSATEAPVHELWRAFIRYCVPSGSASLLQMVSRNLTSLAVTRVLGAAALAQYTIGRFAEPVVSTLRNSVSTVVLPEMVRRDRLPQSGPHPRAGAAALRLWQRATLVNVILLCPIAVIVGRYAPVLIERVFGPHYAPGAVVMQLYMLVMVREAFDFAPMLRALGRTGPLVRSNLAALATCAVALAVLIRPLGIDGAMIAYVLASCVDAAYLAGATLRAHHLPLRQLLPWGNLLKVIASCLLAGVLLLGSLPAEIPDLLAVAMAGLIYLGAFAALLLAFRVPEALALWELARRLLRRRAVNGV